MKALTVRQPWAHLIVKGIKTIENRSWTSHYRGWLLIHSSLTQEEFEEAELGLTKDESRDLIEAMDGPCWSGHIIGAVKVADIITGTAAKKLGAHFSDWAFGPLCWVLESAVAFEKPIKHTGQVGLWEPEPSAARACLKSLFGKL